MAKYKGWSTKSMLLASIYAFAAPAHGFIRHLCYNPLGFGRIDPIMSPGKASQHVHHLHGSGNLGIESTDAQHLLESNCTSCSITVDKSGYWAPAMYFQHENGSFELLNTAGSITIYYKLEKRANFEDQNYTVFPTNFRMVAGNSSKRSWVGPWPVPPQSFWASNDTTQAALAEKAIGFNCMNYKVPGEASLAFPWMRNKTFTDAHCLDGIRAEIIFPSCWDGHSLDSADHSSHVAYPTLIQDGACPGTHPVYLPILFYETIWETNAFIGQPGQYVLANGDPTGFGYHGDFIAAWQDGILDQMTKDPTCTDHNLTQRMTDGLQEKCATVNQTIQSQDKALQCQLKTPNILQKERVAGVVDLLPGNVNVTGVRHDPGTSPDDHQPAAVSNMSSHSSAAAVTCMNSSRTMVPYPLLNVTLSPTLVASSMTHPAQVTTTAPKSVSVSILTTSTYTSNGVHVEVVMVEEIVTTTVIAARRRVHTHGHVH